MTHPEPDGHTPSNPGVPAEPSPADETRIPLARRVAAWVSVIAVVAAGAGALAAADLATAPVAGGDAARFVPADGAAVLVTSLDGTRAVHESARATGPTMLLDLPSRAGAEVFSALPSDALETVQLWRETVTQLDTDRAQSSTIHLLDDRGLSLLTSLGGPVGFVYSPSAVILPADAAPGATWDGEGDAMPGGVLRYTIHGEVAAGEDGCLVSTTESRYLNPETDATLLTFSETATWCPGRGIVKADGDVSGDPVGFSSEPLPAASELDRPTPSITPFDPAWGASGWGARDLSFILSDPVYGDSPQGTPFDGLGARTASGVLVSSFGSRLAAYEVADAVATRRWVAAPGGDLLTLTAVGDVVLATTTTRELVAYDDRGARLWAASFPDVVVAAPAAAPDGDLVAASVDGTLRRLDLATGEERWAVDLRTDVDAVPSVADGRVVLVDRGGAVLARELADGSEAWRADVPLAERVASGDGVVVVQQSAGGIRVLGASDGSTLWRGDQDGAGRMIAVAAGRVVAQTDEGVQAWDLDGRELWSAPAGDWFALNAKGAAVIVGAGAIELRDRDGEVLERVTLAPRALGVSRLHVPTTEGILVVQSNTSGFEVGG